MESEGVPAPVYVAITALVVALTAMVQEMLRERRERKREEKREIRENIASEKTDNLIAETAKVHTAVNSNWEAMKKELAESKSEVAELKDMLNESNLTKAYERISNLEQLLQKVLQRNGLKSEGAPTVMPPVESSQLTVEEGESARVTITKTDD